MVQVTMKHTDPLELVARCWRSLLAITGPLSFEFSAENAAAITGLIDKFLASGKFSVGEPFVMLLMGWLTEYERQHVHIPEASPEEVLRHLMEANGLKQSDLAAELGGQSVVSAILNRRREINMRQARALAARFGVSPAVFFVSAEVQREPAVKREFTSANATPLEVIGASLVNPTYTNEVYVTQYH